MTLAAITFTGVCEVGLVFAIRPSYERGNDIGTLVVGILSSVFIGVGLLPQYWEIYKRREVLGISFLFLFIDMAGGVLNDLSLVFKQTFNILAAITYTLVIVSSPFVVVFLLPSAQVMDGIILVAALLLNPRAARQRKAEVQGRALEENHDSKSDSEITSHVSPAETLETLVNQERTEKVIIKAH